MGKELIAIPSFFYWNKKFNPNLFANRILPLHFVS